MLVFEVANATDEPISRIDDCLRREEHGALAETTHTQIAKVDADITRVGTTSKSYDDVQFNDSSDGDGTKPADTYIALFEFERSADGPGHTQFPNSEWLASLATILTAAGLHIQYFNTYTLLASLTKKPDRVLTA